MIRFRETPTRVILSGTPEEMAQIHDHYSYQPDRYWMSTQYQIWQRHQKAIKSAHKSGNIALAQSLERQKRGWDGWKHVIRMVSQNEIQWVGEAPRGHLTDMVELAKFWGFGANTEACLKNPFAGVAPEDIPDDLIVGKIDPDQWAKQKACIHYWLSSGIGRVKVTVSGGKTAMFCAAASFIKRRFPEARVLYLTPTERLVKQVATEARKFLPGWDITQFGGAGRDQTGKDMVVCTAAILNKRINELKATKWITSFIAVFVDENQYALSPSYRKILSATSAYFRYSASDTEKVMNPDAQRDLVGLCGKIGAKIEAHELIALDRIATPTIKVLEFPQWKGKFRKLEHTAEPNTPAWILEKDWTWTQGTYLGPVYELDESGEIKLNKKKEPIKIPGYHSVQRSDGSFVNAESRWCLLQRRYDQAIINFTDRNVEITKAAAGYSRRGWPTLVIATRTVHVLVLQALIAAEVGPDLVKILFSVHSSAERDEVFKWLTSTPGAVLISPLVKVGVSLNELRGGVVADLVADFELANQMVGRFIRRKPDGTENEAEITMFIDNQHPAYESTTKKLFKHLKGIKGYKWSTSEVQEVDCEELGL